MKRSVSVLVGCVVAAWSVVAFADKPAPPLKGKAPPPEVAPEKSKTVETKSPFDYSELGKRDAAIEKEIAKVHERCLSDPMSREGPTPEETAKCNVAVSKLLVRGSKAAPSILAALNRVDDASSYYAVNRLLFVVGKMDDKKVRKAVVDGLETVTKEEKEDLYMIAYQLPGTLESMLGAAPPVSVPWDDTSVTDHWEEQRNQAEAWGAFIEANAKKTRAQIVGEHLGKARKDKASSDAAAAWRAINFLVQRSPTEALAAANAYLKRDGLESDVSSGFEMLKNQAEWLIEERKGHRG